MVEGLNLKDAYGATLEQVKEHSGEEIKLGMEALMWISRLERLLQLDELLHALTVETGSTYPDTDNVPSKRRHF